MNDLNEIMKEFNRHNLDAIFSMNYLENTQVFHIDTTKHDREIIQNYINKIVEELEMEMKASSGYSAERVSAFSRAIEIVKNGCVDYLESVNEYALQHRGTGI